MAPTTSAKVIIMTTRPTFNNCLTTNSEPILKAMVPSAISEIQVSTSNSSPLKKLIKLGPKIKPKIK